MTLVRGVVVALAVVAFPVMVFGVCPPELIYVDCALVEDGVEYYFDAQAGGRPVYDIYVCVYTPLIEPLEVLATSVPCNWNSEIYEGNCIHYWTCAVIYHRTYK